MFLIMKNQITNYMIPFWRMYTHKYIHTQTKKKKKRSEGYTETLGTIPAWENLVFHIFNLFLINVF